MMKRKIANLPPPGLPRKRGRGNTPLPYTGGVGGGAIEWCRYAMILGDFMSLHNSQANSYNQLSG